MMRAVAMKFDQITRRKWLVGLVCLWLAGGWCVAADGKGVVSEYEVKAALIYNFTKFTDWPASAFASANSPIVVGIAGDDPFQGLLEKTLSGETIKNHPIQVRRMTGLNDLFACHILFVSRSEKNQMAAIIAEASHRPILTISEVDGFGQLGGILNFVMVDKSIRFEINAGAAQQADLKISSKLLNLPKAIKVETKRN